MRLVGHVIGRLTRSGIVFQWRRARDVRIARGRAHGENDRGYANNSTHPIGGVERGVVRGGGLIVQVLQLVHGARYSQVGRHREHRFQRVHRHVRVADEACKDETGR